MIFPAKDIEELLLDFDNIIINFKKYEIIYNNVYNELVNSLKAIEHLQNRINPFIIKNEKDLLVYISFKHSDFLQNKYNIFLLSVLFVLFLTNFNPNALELIKNFIEKVKDDKILNKKKDYKIFKKEIESFIDSSDTRGLLFYLCKIYEEDYDSLNRNVKYIYFEPKIDKDWMKKFYKAGRPIVFWFYRNYMGEGLFVVLYTPKCRYKLEKGGCAGCNLPTLSARDKNLTRQDIENQIDYVFENLSQNEKEELREIIMSNNCLLYTSPSPRDS
jgi:hypothetical protein